MLGLTLCVATLISLLMPAAALLLLTQFCCWRRKKKQQITSASGSEKKNADGHRRKDDDDGLLDNKAGKITRHKEELPPTLHATVAGAPVIVAQENLKALPPKKKSEVKQLKPASPPPSDPNLIHLAVGSYVGEYKVVKRLGEGGCGVVYKVATAKGVEYAMKIERLDLRKRDQLLPMESKVLKRVQFSKYFATFVQYGRSTEFRVLVMDMLGESLSNLQDVQPTFRFKIGTVLRVGVQAFRAIAFLHSVYFVHRDVKPANFAVGLKDPKRIYLLDFGLSRSMKKHGSVRLRRERTDVPFRGTPAYCSVNVHERKEHGRQDDIWGLMYMLVDLYVGSLPWLGLTREQIAAMKEQLSDEEYMPTCPMAFAEILEYLRSLHYNERPDYVGIERAFIEMMKARGVNGGQPMDWETSSAKLCKNKQTTGTRDEKAEVEAAPTRSSDTHEMTEESTEWEQLL